MAVDIVLPDGNEKEFLERGRKLGYDELVFLYKGKKSGTSGKGRTALLVMNNKEAGRQGFDFIVAEGKPWTFQDKRVDIIFNQESLSKKDFMHHRGSGLNQVLAKEAARNNTFIAFSLNQVLKAKEKDVIMGRMEQNVRICRKVKARMILASFADSPAGMRGYRDLQALGRVIGMHPKEAKQAVDW